MSEDRRNLGWTAPRISGVNVLYARDANDVARYAERADSASIHLCQGIRANGLVAQAQRKLAQRGLQQWVLMETVDDHGALGFIKRPWYFALFRWHRSRIGGVLATGHRTADWVVARGVPSTRVFEFAYFLDEPPPLPTSAESGAAFRFLFVGQFVDRKRLPLLISTLAKIHDAEFELKVIGIGPREDKWRAFADRMLPRRVDWVGPLPAERIPSAMADADCLVLPSRHDGWGAVVSEALMAGTQVICSDSCGAAGVVRASGVGGVFARHDNCEFAQAAAGYFESGTAFARAT